MSTPPTIQDVLDNKAPCGHGKLLKDCLDCGCHRCHKDIILADTEDWKRPACFDCWFKLGEPSTDPDVELTMNREVEPTPSTQSFYSKIVENLIAETRRLYDSKSFQHSSHMWFLSNEDRYVLKIEERLLGSPFRNPFSEMTEAANKLYPGGIV